MMTFKFRLFVYSGWIYPNQSFLIVCVCASENGCSSVDTVPPAVFVTTSESIQVLAPVRSLQKAFVHLAVEGFPAQCEHFINLFPRLSPLRLYEMAAEIELRRNNFTKAIKLYQTSKVLSTPDCPSRKDSA